VIGTIGPHQVALDMPGCRQSGQRIHQHREECHQRDDGGLRRPVEAEPHHHDRRHADQRQRREEIAKRQQAAAEEGKTLGDDRDQEARATTDHVADQHAVNKRLDEILPQHRQ
jgi:hypothetical protein